MEILIATKNPAKEREMREFLRDKQFEIFTLADLPEAPDVEETGKTFEENRSLRPSLITIYPVCRLWLTIVVWK